MAALDKDEVVDEAGILPRSYPIDLRYRGLEKRDRKRGTACDYTLQSYLYPSRGSWGDQLPKRYGFNERDSCDDYSMDKPDDSANVLYETEHVLEWQTVVEFFNTVDKEIETKYHHPDPTTNEMVGFCKYWSEHWTYKLNLIDGPSADPAVSPDADAAPDPTDITGLSTGQLVPVHWLAIVYPYREGGEEKWLEEMPLLEKRINGNYKARVCIPLTRLMLKHMNRVDKVLYSYSYRIRPTAASTRILLPKTECKRSSRGVPQKEITAH